MSELPFEIKSSSGHSAHFYALPLASTDTKLFAFERALKSPLVQELKPFAQKLRSKVPQDDLRTLGEIQSALADADHPYGDPPHVIGKPDAIYTRVSTEFLKEKFGEKTARQMGQTWMRKMHGHSIAIGEPLVDAKGEDRRLNFEGAKKACLELNPPETQEEVKKIFEKREAALDVIRVQNKSEFLNRDGSYLFPEVTEEALAKVHQEHPISGCYLMSREEWMMLEGDFGYRESKFIPQIFRKLRNRAFCSSSGNPNVPGYAFVFSGRNGSVYYDYPYNGYSVRCACAAW